MNFFNKIGDGHTGALGKGAGSGGARGAAAPPALWLGGRGGAEGAPQLRKHDIINIHISLNLRRIQKENDKIFYPGRKSAPNLWCNNCANITNKKKIVEHGEVPLSRDCSDTLPPPWVPLSRDSPPLPLNASGTLVYIWCCINDTDTAPVIQR